MNIVDQILERQERIERKIDILNENFKSVIQKRYKEYITGKEAQEILGGITMPTLLRWDKVMNLRKEASGRLYSRDLIFDLKSKLDKVATGELKKSNVIPLMKKNK